jgi:similar to stage IV sporulation protein
MRMSRTDFCRLRQVRRTRCRVHLVRRIGAPFLWKRYRFRFGLWAGLLVVLLTCFALRTRIWVMETSFPDGVDGTAVMRELEALGIHTGMRAVDIDPAALRLAMLEAREDLSFFAANIDGSVLRIVTGAAEETPEVENRTTVRDVVAVKDGVIEKQIVGRGTALCLTGDAVIRGQILVDALVEAQTEWGVDRLVTAEAEIWARTKYTAACVMPKTVEKTRLTGKQTTYYALCFGKTRINFYRKQCAFTENCDRIYSIHSVRLNAHLTLPIALYSETCRYYTSKEQALDESRMQNCIRSGTRHRVRQQLTQGNRTGEEYEWETADGVLTAQTTVWCYEQIGEAVEDGRTADDLPAKETQENEESET